MTTVIEILDTAVKIGLGALISGVTTYAVTNKNHKHERSHGLVVYKRDKLVEITENIKQAKIIINNVVQDINQENKNLNVAPRDIYLVGRIEKVKAILDLISAAHSISHLINDNKLSMLIKEYWDTWHSMNIFFLTGDHNNWDEYNKIREQSIAISQRLNSQFSKSLEEIYT